ncbi:L-seryl-tRNA(Sec) selenium transferase [Nocardioides sp. BP30]|uniref:L-seryl-tRNA(Sec) selenium transferase n=1 Tax=Nocardioides sp. BP30 TaxID=3036374 RepID=UPI0024684F4D|nr:L-seryl-tRNA(Sec) selenium transferase [Nocardioides sp. BP30]WGL51411.1 L-seryl-tRNA(Sec) selenium transferase [Nocardioides sp. BP30]
MTHHDHQDPRRRLPRVDALLADPAIVAAGRGIHPTLLKAAVQRSLAEARAGRLAPELLVGAVIERLPQHGTTLRRVLNATGVVLHTNLGRAPLHPDAVRALEAAAGYVDVEYAVEDGSRARRGRRTLEALLDRVPAAEDALVVNNGAAALVLAATTLAQGREIVVSRGELVEIGDGFRLTSLLESTGARLREVGTTNRTHLADYRDAIGPETGFILKVHPSNFSVQGFTSAVGVHELSTLGVPVVADIGSGLLEPEPTLPDEPDATTWLRQGATIVTASGDKLLGGPQAGLVLGRAEVVHALRRHPLARAVRVDKLTIAALEATLAAPVTPVLAALRASGETLRRRTEDLHGRLVAARVDAPVVEVSGLVGGGGAPGVPLPGWAVQLPAELAARLRLGRPCVVARIERDRCLVDLRCVDPTDDLLISEAIVAAASARH